MLPGDGDAGAGGDDARETEGGGGVDAKGFVDDVVEAGGTVNRINTLRWGRREQDVLGQVFDSFECGNINTLRNCCVELLS